jgi:novobiocin biosynthesis protein NovU/D-mycarose 3-C-methyltransferase
MSYRVLEECRFCGSALRSVMDLGKTPIANALCATEEEALAAPTYPLELKRCEARDCGLLQLSIALRPEVLFPPGYTYATPDNPELTAHYREVLLWLLGLDTGSSPALCVELGSNNGAFLRAITHYTRGSRVLGVEPSQIEAPGIETVRDFFTSKVAGAIYDNGKANPFFVGADLIIARHCLAHIDDVHDVMSGVERLLSPRGIFYIENAYALDTLMGGQFDQLYHEHLSYFTLSALERLLGQHGMKVLDVRLSRVHGGSLMVAAVRKSCPAPEAAAVGLLALAERADPRALERYFVDVARESISALRCHPSLGTFGRRTDAWGAAAKAVTRFAAAQITHQHVRQCYDDSSLKQGKFLPGSGIPIVASPETLDADAVILTAWNYQRSFRARYSSYRGELIVP